MNQNKKNVVVVGGGFAGINFIKKLEKNSNFDITLVDINNYNFFPPLIYQVATAAIEPSNISYPFRLMFRDKQNVHFHMGTLENVNYAAKSISTSTGELNYDYLVLAVGTETNYFGMENVKNNAFPMKTISDALTLRNQMLENFEKASRAKTEEERNKFLNIVIAGGGPSGVEVSGRMAHMSQTILKREYPEFKNLQANIHVVDAGKSLLGPMSQVAQKEAFEVLTNLGVKVTLNTSVKDFVDNQVILSNGETIPTDMLIWTSGVTGREVKGLPTESIGRGRRIMVDAHNEVNGVADVFAIGDICLQTTDTKFPGGHPQLAQVAMQQGELLAENLQSKVNNRPLKAFAYADRGSMAIISKFKAVADLPKFSFTGIMAWFTWLFIHLIPIAGYRNKSKLISNWFWTVITNNPTLRLIMKAEK